MFRPLFAGLFAVAFTVPGCPKNDAPPAPPKSARVQLGQPASEIAGLDLDGEPMKLSEFRGKVVALSFWGSWCHYCRQLFPHEKELVEKFREQPFVFVGADAEREPGEIEIAKKLQTKNQLTWRSFNLGDPEGPIPLQWGVHSYPTTFLIDAQGIVRYRIEGPQPQVVERGINQLLREMETAKR